MRYKADPTAGALKLPESRIIADLLLRQVDPEGWTDAIVTKNVLRARNPATARRLTRLIRGRLDTMGPDLWKLVRDGSGKVATHAILAAAVKHSPLLGDFLDIERQETLLGPRGGDSPPSMRCARLLRDGNLTEEGRIGLHMRREVLGTRRRTCSGSNPCE